MLLNERRSKPAALIDRAQGSGHSPPGVPGNRSHGDSLRHAPHRRRPYLLIGVNGPGNGDTVADLLTRAADDLRGVGPIDVHGLTYEQDTNSQRPSCTLTVYYDRTEHRRTDRS